jgi:Trypsin-like peptidase domain
MPITIKHLDGPLKGTPNQTFDDKYMSVVFGRDPEECQVVYPSDYNVVGKKHFELRRGKAGDYSVGLFGSRYVGIDGNQVDDGDPVASGNVFRLGRKEDGPSFGVEIAKPASKVLADTAVQDEVVSRRQRERDLRRQLIVGGGAIAVALIGIFAALYANHLRTSQLDYQLSALADEASDRAKKEFSQAELDRLKAAVYVVGQKVDDIYKPVATAWAFETDKLATNAHVATLIAKGDEGEFVLFAPSGGKPIQLTKGVSWHPGYDRFLGYRDTVGTTQFGNFKPLGLISQYDVGIITVDPKTPLPNNDPKTHGPVVLDLATKDKLEKLAPGDPVASVGFPTENLAGAGVAAEIPSEMHFGHISALTDVFMCRAASSHLLLVQHSVPVAGGASGSPLINGDGDVIGIVTGGNVTGLKDETGAAAGRIPSAALINFAARADLLDALRSGKSEQQLADEQDYWKTAAERFASYFDSANAAFLALAQERYKVGDAETIELGQGVLKPEDGKRASLVKAPYILDGQAKSGWMAEPGYVYGFIAYAKSGVPVGINVKENKTSKFLRDKQDPRETSERELAPTAWLTVAQPTPLEVELWSYTDGKQPAGYVLYAYRWKLPEANAAASAAQQQSP